MSLLSQIPIIVNPEQFANELTIKTLCEDPPIISIDGLLSPQECSHLINLGKDTLKPSTMVWENKQFIDPGRSSRTANLLKSGDINPRDPIIKKLIWKLSSLSGYKPTHFEALQLLNYQQNQYYVPHHDYFSKNQPSYIQYNGDRCLTFFIYLNDVETQYGGSTHFTDLDLKVQPKQGSAIFWMNMDAEGNYYDKTRHGGSIVTGDVEKWALNLWIRERPY